MLQREPQEPEVPNSSGLAPELVDDKENTDGITM